MTLSAAARSGSPLLYLSILAAALLAWLLCHPYEGLFHDANLYSLQALARLYPESLNADAFLSHGSQDRFTLFSPLYAAAVSVLGIDRAAAALTLLSQLALVSGAWAVASRCLPRWAAALGVVLLVALPCDYGPERIFSCLEPFLTPRMLAEGLALAMLAAALNARPLLAALLGITAMAVHPVMGLAGLVAIFIYRVLGQAWPTRVLLSWSGGLLAVALAGVLLTGRFDAGRFDAEWFGLVAERSPYLFLGYWSFEDWTRAGVIVSALAITGLSLPAPISRFSCVVLLTVLAGWICTLLGADIGHLVLPTQLQAWRWQWLGSATSVLLLPYLLHTLWQSGSRGRAVALALAAGWIFRDGPFALAVTVAALGLRLLPALDARKERLLLGGAVALLVLAGAWRIASNLEFTDVHYMDATLPLTLRRAMSFARDGSLLALLAGCVLLLEWRRLRAAQWAVFIALLAATAAAAPYASGRWLSRSYPDSLVARFESWRALIPPRADVLWNESPLGAWALLQRPNYISGLQTSGMVFSRAAAMDLKQRAEMLASVVPLSSFLDWSGVGLTLSLSPDAVLAVCRLGVVPYLVTSTDLGMEPLAQLSAQEWPVSHGLKLYRCSG